MNFMELMKKTRSTRRFKENISVSEDTLYYLLEAASFCPSAMNRQPLKYVLSHSEELNDKIFECLIWAPYIKEWAGPEKGERPAAYMIMCVERSLAENVEFDAGIQAHCIALAAADISLGSCIMEKVNFKKLAKIIDLDESLEPILVIALGEPDEEIVIDDIVDEAEGGHGIKFYHDEEGRHHVPKRKAGDMLLAVNSSL